MEFKCHRVLLGADDEGAGQAYYIMHRNEARIVLVNYFMNSKLKLRSSSQTAKKSENSASHYTLMAAILCESVQVYVVSTPQELDRNPYIDNIQKVFFNALFLLSCLLSVFCS